MMKGGQNFMTRSIFNSDYLGAAASGLCIIHCLLTPVLFVVQASSSLTCSEISPGWWSAIDYLFLAVTFFAIRATTRSTTSGWIAQALYLSWAILAIVIVNESLHLLPLSPMIKYIPAGLLVTLHLYNLKYCRCEDDVCSSE